MAQERRLRCLTDRSLVGLAQSGSLEAYDELVHRFRGAVVFVAGQHLASREVAQEVAQEVFLSAFHNLRQLQDPERFASWLYAITRHRARRTGQRENRSETAETMRLEHLLHGTEGCSGPTPLEAVLKAEREKAALNALAELPAELQIVLLLFHVEAWPAARIAAFLSLPLTTVKWRLRSGRAQLRGRYATLFEEKNDV